MACILAAGVLLTAAPAHAEPTAAQIDQRITAAAHKLEIIVERYNDLRVDQRETSQRAAALDRQLTPLKTDIDQRQRVLGGIAADVYRQNVRGPSLSLLGAESPGQFVERLLTVNRVDSEQRRATDELNAARERVERTRASLNALANQQRHQQAQLAATKATVEAEIARLTQMRRAAYGNGYRYTDDPDLPPPPYVAGPAGKAVAFAYAQIGKPYSWGADGPDSYDCSGLTLAAWRQAGVELPHNARRQYGSTAHISRADLHPGDLIFYYGGISHVAMYIGGGKMIHAPEYGERVRIADVDLLPIHGYGRPG